MLTGMPILVLAHFLVMLTTSTELLMVKEDSLAQIVMLNTPTGATTPRLVHQHEHVVK